jgi:SAM-dependent methyltransferase
MLDPTTQKITNSTLNHYEREAQSYWEGTRDHDVSQNIAALLKYIQLPAPLKILDLGCGPGRDLITFKRMGHEPVGLEGAKAAAELARVNSGCTVLEQNFLELDLPANHFDGVFANASLFHVPSANLSSVLKNIIDSLKPEGVFFSSNPRGQGQADFHGERYGVFHSWEIWQAVMVSAGFLQLEHFYRPQGLPFEQQRWLASVWRKPAKLQNHML